MKIYYLFTGTTMFYFFQYTLKIIYFSGYYQRYEYIIFSGLVLLCTKMLGSIRLQN